MESKFDIQEEFLDNLFPFHFWLDENLKVVRAGDGILKLHPSILNSPFESEFNFKRPGFDISFSFDSISEYVQQVFILESRSTASLIFRGQFSIVNKHLLFVGSPWLQDVSDLDKFGLLVTDFAIHDPITDMLQVLKVHQIALDDMKEQQRALVKKSKEISDLARFPSENPNPVVRIDLDGRIIYANKACDYLLDQWGCEVNDLYPKEYSNIIHEVIRSNRNAENVHAVGNRHYLFQYSPFLEEGIHKYIW